MRTGYTLVELLTTLACVVVLGSLASPDLRALSERMRADASLQNLTATINFARHLAMTERVTVSMCPGASGRCERRDTWQRGAIVFVDRNGNGRIDATDRIARRMPALSSGFIRWRSFRNRTFLSFTRMGYTNWQSGHFQYCPADGNPRFARQVILNAQGRARAARDRDGDGIRENARGQPLTC